MFANLFELEFIYYLIMQNYQFDFVKIPNFKIHLLRFPISDTIQLPRFQHPKWTETFFDLTEDVSIYSCFSIAASVQQ